MNVYLNAFQLRFRRFFFYRELLKRKSWFRETLRRLFFVDMPHYMQNWLAKNNEMNISFVNQIVSVTQIQLAIYYSR